MPQPARLGFAWTYLRAVTTRRSCKTEVEDKSDGTCILPRPELPNQCKGCILRRKLSGTEPSLSTRAERSGIRLLTTRMTALLLLGPFDDGVMECREIPEVNTDAAKTCWRVQYISRGVLLEVHVGPHFSPAKVHLHPRTHREDCAP